MSWIVSTAVAQKVPQAASGGGETPAIPETTTIATNEYTVPIATSHLESLTLTIDAANAAGTAEVYHRADNQAAWGLLDTLDISSGLPVAERFECPMGQVRVRVLVATSATVYAQGVPIN